MKFLSGAKVSQLVVAIFFALHCVFPSQALLSLQNCGKHEIVSCRAHDDQHFVALHTSEETKVEGTEQKVSFDGEESPIEEHDAAHQIENVKLALSSIEVTSANNIKILYVMTSGVITTQPISRFNSNIWLNNNVALAHNSFLSSLTSVRLQV